MSRLPSCKASWLGTHADEKKARQLKIEIRSFQKIQLQSHPPLGRYLLTLTHPTKMMCQSIGLQMLLL